MADSKPPIIYIDPTVLVMHEGQPVLGEMLRKAVAAAADEKWDERERLQKYSVEEKIERLLEVNVRKRRVWLTSILKNWGIPGMVAFTISAVGGVWYGIHAITEAEVDREVNNKLELLIKQAQQMNQDAFKDAKNSAKFNVEAETEIKAVLEATEKTRDAINKDAKNLLDLTKLRVEVSAAQYEKTVEDAKASNASLQRVSNAILHALKDGKDGSGLLNYLEKHSLPLGTIIGVTPDRVRELMDLPEDWKPGDALPDLSPWIEYSQGEKSLGASDFGKQYPKYEGKLPHWDGDAKQKLPELPQRTDPGTPPSVAEPVILIKVNH